MHINITFGHRLKVRWRKKPGAHDIAAISIHFIRYCPPSNTYVSIHSTTYNTIGIKMKAKLKSLKDKLTPRRNNTVHMLCFRVRRCYHSTLIRTISMGRALLSRVGAMHLV
jgi:hypothetical protein